MDIISKVFKYFYPKKNYFDNVMKHNNIFNKCIDDTKTIDDFDIIDNFEAFSNSHFFRAKLKNCSDNRIILIKKVSKELSDSWDYEKKALGRLSHENIIKMLYCFEEDSYIFYALEYINGFDLFTIIFEKGDIVLERDIKIMFKQLTKAVEYIHNQNIAHCDIKLENIMLCLETGKIILIDFGLARDALGKTVRKGGTDICMSPEAILGDRHDIKKGDIWAMGICLYAMIYCGYPFYVDKNTDFILLNDIGEEYNLLNFKIVNTEPDYFDEKGDAVDLIKLLLNKDYNQRIDINGVIEHDYLK